MGYFLNDAMGSMRQLADASSNVTLARSYDPHGNVLSTSGSGSTSYAFDGEWQDNTSLIYLRARYYGPGMGRFLTKDSWPGSYTNPLTLNGWAFVNNNPINLFDPSGHCVVAGHQMADSDPACAYLSTTSTSTTSSSTTSTTTSSPTLYVIPADYSSWVPPQVTVAPPPPPPPTPTQPMPTSQPSTDSGVTGSVTNNPPTGTPPPDPVISQPPPCPVYAGVSCTPPTTTASTGTSLTNTGTQIGSCPVYAGVSCTQQMNQTTSANQFEFTLGNTGNCSASSSCQQQSEGLTILGITFDALANGMNAGYALTTDIATLIYPPLYVPMIGYYRAVWGNVANGLSTVATLAWTAQGFVTGDNLLSVSVNSQSATISGSIAQDTIVAVGSNSAGWFIPEPNVASIVDSGVLMYDIS